MTEMPIKTRQVIAEEAAAWFVEFQEQPPARSARRRFVAWLTESPVHVEEYLAIAKVFGALQNVDPRGEIDVESLADETVVALHGDVEAGNAAERPAARRRWARFGLAAGGLLAMIAAGAFYAAVNQRPLSYATALGEQRSVVLEDGSMVSLNTSTRIEVAFGDQARQVRLLAGEALFDVEKDPGRPFLVETPAAVIRVTGTQFNVYEQNGGTAVTVLEGKVEVRPRGAEAAAAVGPERRPQTSAAPAHRVAELAAGQQALLKRGSAEVRTVPVVNLEPVTAWTERRLVFDATPLSEIVQQFNRYNRERLVLDDPALASLELSGVFGSNDPQSLLLFLKRVVDVEVITSADGSEIRIRAVTKR